MIILGHWSLTSHFKGIKEEDGAQEVGFPSSDNVEESIVARYNATVAELAHVCHCLKTQGLTSYNPGFQLVTTGYNPGFKVTTSSN